VLDRYGHSSQTRFSMFLLLNLVRHGGNAKFQPIKLAVTWSDDREIHLIQIFLKLFNTSNSFLETIFASNDSDLFFASDRIRRLIDCFLFS
jgi:hypothetical protein